MHAPLANWNADRLILLLIGRHHHEDWDANRTSLTLDSYLDRYQRTAACQQKDIMICRSCNSAIYNVSLTASEHNSYHVWCFGSGVFTRLPKVRLNFTRIESILRMHRLKVGSFLYAYACVLFEELLRVMNSIGTLQVDGSGLYHDWIYQGTLHKRLMNTLLVVVS